MHQKYLILLSVWGCLSAPDKAPNEESSLMQFMAFA